MFSAHQVKNNTALISVSSLTLYDVNCEVKLTNKSSEVKYSYP